MGVVGANSLGRLRTLGLDRGRCVFVELSGLFAVEIAVYRLRESGQEVLAHFQAIALALEANVDEPQLPPLANL